MQMERKSDPNLKRTSPMEFGVATDVQDSQTIDLSGYAGCRMRLEDGAAGAFEIWECESKDGTFGRSTVKGADASITLPAKPGWAEIPPEMFPAHFIRLVGPAAASVVLMRKS